MRLDIIIPVGPGHDKLVNEAIQSIKIACRTSKGPFDDIKIKAIDDTKGELGRSKSRNTAIKSSKSDWLFFLDADDLMYPTALKSMSDYSGYDAVWGNICEFKDHCVVQRFQMPRIELFDDLLDIDPYYTLQMGFFVQRDCMMLFNEEMDCGEDWEVYLKLWKKFHCIKQESFFMVNRRGFHSEGDKSATGRQWMDAVSALLEGERRARELRKSA